MTDKSGLMQLLSSPIAYYATLAKVSGGATSGIFLSQLLYWTGRGKQADGWVWKSAREMEDETGLTHDEQLTARRNLKARGFVQERVAGVPATVHYRVDLEKILAACSQFAEKQQTGLLENSKLDSRKSANLPAEKQQTIHRLPETTTEITADDAPQNVEANTMMIAQTARAGKASSSPTQTSPREPLRDDLIPNTPEEKRLFQLLAECAGGKGRRPGKARFANPQQARDFRAAVQVLNGRTVGILEAFFRQGNDGLGRAVSYVTAAAKKEPNHTTAEPVEVLSW